MTYENIDQAKERVKEAAGALTGDRGLKNEGRADQAKVSLKKAVDRVADTVKGLNRSNERGQPWTLHVDHALVARNPNKPNYRRTP